ncbi:MAG: SDR family NAD(P)-dependent oxidoreductase [Candidatus Tectomicrobia bacterium]|nr:SDR family NAD(P)-dependent oxidoreductase [Candidatus Tectomicrobia bacterium]
MPQKVLEGKRAVVTGASAGMGAAFAMKFASEGASIWAAGGSDAEGLRRTIEGCAKHGVRAGGKGYSLARSQDAARLVRDGAEFLGGLDILFNCAGTRNFKPIAEVEDEEIELLFQVNAKAAYIASREAARIMVPQRSGKILMLGSDAGEHGTANFSLYSCTKAVMHNLTKCLAIELGPLGIRRGRGEHGGDGAFPGVPGKRIHERLHRHGRRGYHGGLAGTDLRAGGGESRPGRIPVPFRRRTGGCLGCPAHLR